MFLFLASLNISQKRRKEENETHTGLLCNSNKTHSRRTNRKQNKTKTKKCRENGQRDLTSAEETKKTQKSTTYLKLLPRRRRLRCEETLVCVLLPQPPSDRAQPQLREGKGKGKRKVLYGGDGDCCDGVCYGQEGIWAELRAGMSNGPHITGSNR